MAEKKKKEKPEKVVTTIKVDEPIDPKATVIKVDAEKFPPPIRAEKVTAREVARESELRKIQAEMKQISDRLPSLKNVEHPEEYTNQYQRLMLLAQQRDILVAESNPAPEPDAPRTLADVEADMKKISDKLPKWKQEDPERYNVEYNRLLDLAKERDELRAAQ